MLVSFDRIWCAVLLHSLLPLGEFRLGERAGFLQATLACFGAAGGRSVRRLADLLQAVGLVFGFLTLCLVLLGWGSSLL